MPPEHPDTRDDPVATHGAQGAVAGQRADDPANQPNDDAPLTVTALQRLLAAERRETAKLVNRAVTAHLKRPAPPVTDSADDVDDDSDDADEGTPEPTPTPRAKPRQAADPMVRKLRKELERTNAAIAERDEREKKRDREAALRDAIESADPVSTADAFAILKDSTDLRLSEDGRSFVVTSDDGDEVPLADWAKKQIAARPHLLKVPKSGAGAAPRGGAPHEQKGLDRNMSGAKRLAEIRRREMAAQQNGA